MNFRQYFGSAKMEMKNALAYKANLIFYLTYVVIPPLAIFFLWSFILKDGKTIQTYNLTSMVTYFIITQLFVTNTPFSAWSEIGDGIRNGNLTLWLLKPTDHYILYLFRLVGSWIPLWITSFGGVSIVVLVLHKYIQFQSDIIVNLVTILFWFGGVVFGFTLGYLFNLLAFWIDRSSGVLMLSASAAYFLSGAVFPLDILPLKEIWLWLPYKYCGFFPAQVYLGRIPSSEWIIEFIKLCSWILISLILTKIIWRIGIKRYQAAGG